MERRLFQHSAESTQQAPIFLPRSGRDPDESATVEPPFVAAIPHIDAVSCEERADHLRCGSVEFDEREVCCARVGLHVGQSVESGEQGSGVADVSASGALIVLLEFGVAEQTAEPLCECVEISERSASQRGHAFGVHHRVAETEPRDAVTLARAVDDDQLRELRDQRCE